MIAVGTVLRRVESAKYKLDEQLELTNLLPSHFRRAARKRLVAERDVVLASPLHVLGVGTHAMVESPISGGSVDLGAAYELVMAGAVALAGLNDRVPGNHGHDLAIELSRAANFPRGTTWADAVPVGDKVLFEAWPSVDERHFGEIDSLCRQKHGLTLQQLWDITAIVSCPAVQDDINMGWPSEVSWDDGEATRLCRAAGRVWAKSLLGAEAHARAALELRSPHALNLYMNAPVLRLRSGEPLVVFPTALQQKATFEGFAQFIRDLAREQGKDYHDKVKQGLDKAVEAYVLRAITDLGVSQGMLLTESEQGERWTGDGNKRCDLLYVDDEWVVALDVMYRPWSRHVGVNGGSGALATEIGRGLEKKAAQIDSAVSNVLRDARLRGPSREVIGVVVNGATTPRLPIVWDAVDEILLNSEGVEIRSADEYPVLTIDITDLELLRLHSREGVRGLVRSLSRWATSTFYSGSARNWIAETGPLLRQDPLGTSYINKASDRTLGIPPDQERRH